MKTINQLVYSIACIFAIVTACTALPINVASMDHASEVMIGLLALTCISITILACTCCHRNKSGFEEFENENTIADQTNSVSEFPIFRAISPLNAGHTLNSAPNNSENRILSNIVNQNQINRTFNEFENNQNNNGPISAVDMENIQNNNAIDYIPNRNEINITIDPSPHAINRNLVDVNGDSSNSLNTTSLIIEQSIPMLVPPEFDNIASGSNYDSYCQLNEFSEYCLDEPPAVSESLNNYIDLEDDANAQTSTDTEMPNECKACPNMVSEQNSQKNFNMEINLGEDDAVSVEEALRALDFAISGGESFFSDDQEDDTSTSDESENECEDTNFSTNFEKNQSENIELNRTVNAKDKFNRNEAELNVEKICDNSNNQYKREDVYEVAKALVDNMLEQCNEKISLMTPTIVEIHNECENISDENVIGAQITDTKQINETVTNNNLDDSMDETFLIGKLDASTPCHKTFTNLQKEKNEFKANLFHTLDEVNESALSNDGIELLQTSHTQIGCVTFDMQSTENQLATTFIKNDDKTFISTNQPDLQETFNIEISEIKLEVPIIIKIDKEEVNSDDLTTVTPMNTPIELNYVGETWDQLVSKSMNKKSIKLPENDDESQATTMLTISKNSWFLHPPQTDETFNINDVDYSNYDGTDEESAEENAELLSLTFDALRKQLADVLPQASVRPSVEYSDDEDNVSDSDPDCESLEYHNKLENPRSEVFINYKQQLSPILEESEDETCKTFVMNETKCLDSTSTGCIETSEAIMGVTKVLMASNDTLFNFEDTLGDREDMLSPRNLVSSASNTNISTTPQTENCKTPTNEAYLHAYPVEYRSNEFNTFNENQMSNEIRPNSLPFNFENLTNNLGDLLSPEQQKTFSEEINTIEQLSSDLSATIDATNTLDDLKTCISVHLNDDANSGRLDVSENEAIAIDQNQTNILAANETHTFIEQDNLSQHSQDIYQTKMPDTYQNADEQNSNENGEKMIKDIHLDLFTAENVKENKSPNLDRLNSDSKTEEKINHNKMFEVKQISDKCNCQPQNHPDTLNESVEPLSGEEDPWATHPITDIRFSGPGFDDEIQQMTGTFTTNDCWDSDIEDSNSSEEFLYAKGASQICEYLKSRNQNNAEHNELIKHGDCNAELGDEQINTQNIWNSHEDLIDVTTKIDTDDLLEESSISENETEWIPSSWDNLAKPVRSALKSPDKSSSRTGTKNRRSVGFKKQNYQSVYEYPKENASFSPTMSEPSGWATYLATSSPFSSSTNSPYGNKSTDESNESRIDFNALDGFAVSSSSRPFHLSQFSTECHTWPTDSEFSWSQMQSDKDHANTNVNYPVKSMGLQTNLDKNSGTNDTYEETRELKSRPDSGVGESGDLSESFSLGDLCHTKSSLRLPLNVYSINSITNEKELTQPTTPADDQNECSKSISQNDYSENVVASDSMDSIVPTSGSCTGSMDSINSFDGGKSSLIHLNNSTNTDGLLLINTTETKNVSNETPIHNDNITQQIFRMTASDSTDEDSGIENIVRSKEI